MHLGETTGPNAGGRQGGRLPVVQSHRASGGQVQAAAGGIPFPPPCCWAPARSHPGAPTLPPRTTPLLGNAWALTFFSRIDEPYPSPSHAGAPIVFKYATFLNLINIYSSQKSCHFSKWIKRETDREGAKKVTFHCLFMARYYYE